MVVNDFFTLTPHGNQSYLVFNYQQYPEVETWNFCIKETKTEDSATTTQIIKRYGHGGVNYGRVPLEYLRNYFEEGIVYSLEATGFNALAEPVITTTIGNLCTGCLPGEIIKTFKCNGRTYA